LPDVGRESVEALARRAAEGDEAAFDRLVRRIHPRLVRWALVKTTEVDDADEVVQRTLVRMYRALPGFRGDSRITTWAYRIATNVWLDMQRAEKTRSRVEEPLMEDVEHAAAAATPSPDARVERAEEADLLRRFFADLAPRQREVLELVDLQGLEPSEAASAMEVTPSTARVHLHRARRALRRIILDERPELAEEYGT
jgi:RNA polymerase sigma-70 factor (ECF subfamily)